MPAVNRLRRRDLLTLLVVLFAAALARYADPGIVEFKLDEAWLTRLAREFAAGGPLPLTGMPSSVGIPNPPTSVYIMALPFTLTSSPLVATLFVAALNVAGVGLLWLLAMRYAGRTVALVAGLMYALSPWATLYSRKIWAQDIHTPLVVAALLLGLSGFREGRRWAQLVCLPLLIVALQVHLAAWALLPLYLWLLWAGRRRAWWPGVILSLGLAVLTLLPYAVGLGQSERGSGDVAGLLAQRGIPPLSGSALLYAGQLATGLGVEVELVGLQAGRLLAAVPQPGGLWLLPGLLVVPGLLLGWLPRYRILAGLLWLWALLPVIVFSVEWTDIYPHYFIASIPAFCLLAGVTVDWLARHLPGQPLSRTIVLTAFAVVVLTQNLWWRGAMRYISEHGSDHFGTPLGQLMPLRDILLDEAHVVLVTGDARLDYSTPPATWHAMLSGEAGCFQAVSDATLVVLPPGPFALLMGPGIVDNPPGHYALGEWTATMADDDTRGYRLFRQSQAVDEVEWSPVREARFANGVALTGYQLTDDGVRLHWQTPAARNVQYQYFVHLLDASGERVGQVDGPFLDGRLWCDDSAVVTQRAFPVPPQARTLRVGLYRLVSDGFANADLLGADGSPVAPWLDVPLSAG